MATQPPFDGAQGKPDELKSPPAPKTDPTRPNLALDAPAPKTDPTLPVDPALESHVVEVVPIEEVDAIVLGEDDVVDAEPVDAEVLAEGASESAFVFADEEPVEAVDMAADTVVAKAADLAAEVEQPSSVEPAPANDEAILADEVIEVTGSSAVLAEPDAVAEVAQPVSVSPVSDVDLAQIFAEEAPVVAAEPVPTAPVSDVDLAALFAEESPVAAAEPEPTAPVSDVADAELFAEGEPSKEFEPAAPVSDVDLAALFAEESPVAAAEPEPAAPVSDVADVELFAEVEPSEESEPAAPVSDVDLAALFAEESPVAAAEPEPAAPVSDVADAVLFAKEEPVTAAEAVPDAPATEVDLASLFAEESPVVAAVDAPAVPVSDVADAELFAEVEPSAEPVLEVNLAEPFADEPAVAEGSAAGDVTGQTPALPESPSASPLDWGALAAASAPVENAMPAAASLTAATEDTPQGEAALLDEGADEIALASDVTHMGAIVGGDEAVEVAEAAPPSDFVSAEEIGAVVAPEELVEVAAAESGLVVEGEIAEAEERPEPATSAVVPESASEAVEGASSVEVEFFDDVVEEPAEHASAPEALAAEEIAEQPSDILAADEVTEAAPESEVLAADEVVEEVAEAAPESEILAADEVVEEVAETAAESEVLAADEVVEEVAETAAESEVLAADEVVEEVAEAAAESEVLAADEVVEEVAEAAPESEIFAADELVEEVAEATPESEIFAADEVIDEIAEAEPESATVAADEIEEGAPASEVVAGEVEAGDEVSSATRKAEAVLDDEGMSAATASDAEANGSGAVLDDVPAAEGSAVKKLGGGGKTLDFAQTLAFEPPPSSRAKKIEEDTLVTEEELFSGSEAPAGDLGLKEDAASVEFDELLDEQGDAEERPSSAAARQPVGEDSTEMDADAIEEDFDSVPATPVSKKDQKHKKKAKTPTKATGDDIDLDELFGEEAEAVEEEAEAVEYEEAEAVEAAEEDEDFEAAEEEAEAAEAFDEEEEAVDAEDEVAEAAEAFDEEEEVAEAVDAEDEVAEAAEAFDEEEEVAEAVDAEDEVAEAAEAFDEEEEVAEAVDAEEAEEAEATDDDELADFADADEPVKTKAKSKTKLKAGKKAHLRDEEEEDQEEDEDTSSKKKGKKGKTKIAAPEARPSRVLNLLGGMFLAGFLLTGGVGAGWFFAPAQLVEVAEHSPNFEKKKSVEPPPIKIGLDKKKPVDVARDLMASAKFQDAVTSLKDAADSAELSARGEAKWLVYFEKNKAALDKDDPAVKDALDDLKKAKADLLIAQIDATLREKELTDQLTSAVTDKAKVDKQLKSAVAAKVDVDKLVDDVAGALVKAKLIEDKTKFDFTAVPKIVESLNTDKVALDKVNEILKDHVKEKAELGLKELLDLKKTSDDYKTEVAKALKDAKGDDGAKGVAKIAGERDGLKTEVKMLDDVLVKALKPLVDGKIFLKKNPDPRKDLEAATTEARLKAESPLSVPLGQLGLSLGGIGSGTSKLIEESLSMAKTVTELKWFQTREEFIQTPQEKMNTHISLLQDRSHKDKDALKAIDNEADWVLSKKSKSDEESQHKASYVKGLTLRNLENFGEARKVFEETLKKVQPMPKVGPWKDQLARSHKELTDPNFYYIPRMDMYLTERDLKAALAEANTALKAIPDDANLFVRRGLIRYEFVRGKGTKIPADTEKEIRADADTAAKDAKVAAESAFLIGMLEEDLGKYDDALKLYKKAIDLNAAADGPPDDAGKYRVARARLLLKERPEAAPAAAPAPVDDEKKKKDDKLGAAPLEQTIPYHPWSLLAVSTIIAQPPAEELEDKETLARLKEVMDEADKLKQSKNPKLQGQGYCLMGSALTKVGKRTEGLKEFAKGLELLYPGIETKEINELIEAHPAFQQPDAANVPNPIMAERHFGEGMHLYWKGALNPKGSAAPQDFKDAEQQFRQAIKYYNVDPRYQYYMGLAQYQQFQIEFAKSPTKASRKKRDDAIDCFERGARLEAKTVQTNPFAIREINQSLERIQGELRQMLNHYRYRPATEPETKKEVE